MKPVLAAACLGLALLPAITSAGCAVVQDKTLGESLDEASASSQVKARLLAASPQRFSEIDVEVADRFVLLSGRVVSEADRVEAERIAWTVETLDEVANEIIVADRSFAREVSDEWITAQVRTRLYADKAVKAVNYNIETYAGVVYLLGIAQSTEELQAAAEHASLVNGVVKVVSYVKTRSRDANMAARALPTETPARPAAPAPIEGGGAARDRTGGGQAYTDPYARGAPAAAAPVAQPYPELAGAPAN